MNLPPPTLWRGALSGDWYGRDPIQDDAVINDLRKTFIKLNHHLDIISRLGDLVADAKNGSELRVHHTNIEKRSSSSIIILYGPYKMMDEIRSRMIHDLGCVLQASGFRVLGLRLG